MSTWPVTLPQSPRGSGFSQRDKSATIRSPMGYGPDKTRRRTTAVIQEVACNMALTDAQKDTLIAFYETDTAAGALSFDWIDHLNGGAVAYRFLSPPQWSYAGCDNWLVQMSLEVMP